MTDAPFDTSPALASSSHSGPFPSMAEANLPGYPSPGKGENTLTII